MNQRFWSWLLIGACLLTTTACKNDKQPAGVEGSEEGGLQRVTLMLNWFPEAEHGGFYAAKVHGIYEKFGLDVTIEPGGPNAPVDQELLTGRVQFAIGIADDVLVFREQEVPVVALMAPIQDTPRCILVHSDSGAKTLSDLKGLTLQAGNGRPYLEYMNCLLYTSPSPRDRTRSRMPSSACKNKELAVLVVVLLTRLISLKWKVHFKTT